MQIIQTIISFVCFYVILLFIRRLIKKLFLRNDKEAYKEEWEKSVPWKYVKREVIQAKNCPNCGLEPPQLLWFEFSTSSDSWKDLCGEAGYYSKCPKCNIVVDSITTRMN